MSGRWTVGRRVRLRPRIRQVADHATEREETHRTSARSTSQSSAVTGERLVRLSGSMTRVSAASPACAKVNSGFGRAARRPSQVRWTRRGAPACLTAGPTCLAPQLIRIVGVAACRRDQRDTATAVGSARPRGAPRGCARVSDRSVGVRDEIGFMYQRWRGAQLTNRASGSVPASKGRASAESPRVAASSAKPHERRSGSTSRQTVSASRITRFPGVTPTPPPVAITSRLRSHASASAALQRPEGATFPRRRRSRVTLLPAACVMRSSRSRNDQRNHPASAANRRLARAG